MDSFCDEKIRYILQLQILLSSFNKIYHVANVADFTHREKLLRGQIFVNQVRQNNDRKYPRMMFLVWYTRTSYGLTQSRGVLNDYVKCNIPVKEVTKVNRIIGIGTTLHKFIDSNGKYLFFPCISYHLD